MCQLKTNIDKLVEVEQLIYLSLKILDEDVISFSHVWLFFL